MKVFKIVRKDYIEALENELRTKDNRKYDTEKRYKIKLKKYEDAIDAIISNSKQTKKTAIVEQLKNLREI